MLLRKLSPIFAVDILLTRKQNAIKAIFWDYQRLFLEKGADLFEEAKEYTPEEAIEKVFGIKLNKTDNNEQGNDTGGSHETGTSETGGTAGNGELGRGERQTEGESGAAEQAAQQPAVGSESARQPKEEAEGGTETAPQPVGGVTAQDTAPTAQGETAQAIAAAEAETDTNPTEGQKEAGNYKKGHVRIIETEPNGKRNGKGVKQQKGDGKAARVSARERKMRDAIVGLLRKAGIDVVTDSEEGQRVLDMENGRGVTLNKAQKRTLETARLNQQEEGTKGTVVSSEDGAKVLKNLDILAESLEKITNRSKTFVGDVAKALGAKQFGSKSQYATFETKNGQTVTIRLGNHNATVSSFDNNGEDNGISIVISRHENKGITNDGKAHLVEYFYSDKAINRAEGKPLADIVRSIKQALYSGEYKDTTGLAERGRKGENTETSCHA